MRSARVPHQWGNTEEKAFPKDSIYRQATRRFRPAINSESSRGVMEQDLRACTGCSRRLSPVVRARNYQSGAETQVHHKEHWKTKAQPNEAC
jgi:hypothetical protein